MDIEKAFLADLGLVYDDVEFMTRFVGTSDADFVAMLRADHAARGKGLFPDDFLDRVRAACWDRFTTDLRAIDGVKHFLEALNCPIAVASSSTVRSLRRKLSLTGLAGSFGDHVYSAEVVQNGKPAPDLFLHAATQLSISPPQCVVIEDSINGVKAGVAAGMQVWGFTGGGHADNGLEARLKDAGADRVYQSFRQMNAI